MSEVSSSSSATLRAAGTGYRKLARFERHAARQMKILTRASAAAGLLGSDEVAELLRGADGLQACGVLLDWGLGARAVFSTVGWT